MGTTAYRPDRVDKIVITSLVWLGMVGTACFVGHWWLIGPAPWTSWWLAGVYYIAALALGVIALIAFVGAGLVVLYHVRKR